MAGEKDRMIGRELRRIRERKGISQPILARRLGMPLLYLHGVECGSIALNVTDIFFFADALGYDPRDLMDEIGRAVA